jgi:zinc/manganese transport system permease protein
VRTAGREGGVTPYNALVEPFVEFGFMRRALIACLALSIGSGPIGVLLLLRRMSLIGDAMSHAVLPGAAVGFLFAGLSLPAMGVGGLVAGLAVALLSGLVSRTTELREADGPTREQNKYTNHLSFYCVATSRGPFFR